MEGNSAKREDVQKIILALLVSQQSSIPLTHLDRDYREQEGEYIPWKEFGYISLFDYLRSIPKYFYLERKNDIYYVSGIATDKSKHISSLVARQKETLKKSPYTRRTFRPSCYYPKTQPPRIYIPANILSDIIHIVRNNPNGTTKEHILKKVNEKLPRMNISVIDLEEQFKELSHELYVQGNLIFPGRSKTKFIPEQYVSPIILSNVEENLQSQCIAPTPKYCVSGDSDSEPNIDDDNDFALVCPDNVSNNTNGNNKSTILKKKQPISMFLQETVSKRHIQGDKCNDTFMHTIKETEYNNIDNKVTLDTSTKSNHEVDITYLDDECAELLINDRTKLRLEKLIQKYPHGIWCAELPEKFLTEYNRSLHYTELGFNSVREFASYLPEIFECKQLQPLGDFILYDAKKKLIDAQKKDRTKSPNMAQIYTQLYQDEDELKALPFIISSDTSNKLMPEGVMVIGESVGQISVIDLETRLQPYIEVFVEEVFTPSFFWVQLRKKKKLFNKLMEDLHTFYQEKSSLYKIPLVVLEKGLNCACIYNNQWHRGIIKTVKPDSQVTVMFYDYGTLKTYPPEAIYYLHRSFSYMVAQAIPCGLYNTKPCIGEQWTRGVTHEFAIRTSQRPLIATVVSTDSENNSMLVTLTDTMEEEDVHINDWLVLQNLAVHGKMGDVVDMSNIMLFDEDNLLYHADKCYGKDYLIPNVKNNDDSTECSANIPLISPQSTLHEKPCKLITDSSLYTESLNLLTFLQGNSPDNDKSVLNPFVSAFKTDQDIQSNEKTLLTNPFLDDMGTCQDYVNNLSPEMFMEIWGTNLRLQVQITTIFNILMAKLGSTAKTVNNYSSEKETKENYEQRLLHASELLESIIVKEDISSLLASKTANYSTNTKFNTSYNENNEIYIPSFLNSNNYATAKPSEINDNSITKALLQYLKQIEETNGVTSNSSPQATYNKSAYLGQDISSHKHKSVMNNLKIEPSTLRGQNGFIDNKKDQCHSVWSKQFNGFNETNPFKILIKLKDCKSRNASQAENINTDFEKYCSLSSTNFNKNHFEVNDIGNHTSTIQHDYTSSTNKSVLNPFHFECLSTIEKDPYHSFQNTNKPTFQPEMLSQSITKDQYPFKKEYNVSHENSGTSLKPDYNYFNVHAPTCENNNIKQLVSPKFSSTGESVMHNEEFSWFDKSNNPSNSPILQKLFNKTSIESPNISAETWIRDAKNTILSQAQFQDEHNITIEALTDTNSSRILNKNQQFETNIDSPCYYKNVELDLTYDSNKEYMNDGTSYLNFSKENNVNSKIYNEDFQKNVTTNDINYNGQQIKYDHDTIPVNMRNRMNDQEIDIPYYEFLISTATGLTKLFFQTVEIKNRTFCIFHFEDEGWLLLNDFVEEFTTYGTISEYYKQLQICRINISFKEISRSKGPTLFFHLDKMLPNVFRDNANKVNNIHLMPLKSIITVLVKLKIVTRAEVVNIIVEREFMQYSILHKAWMLIRTYGKLKLLFQEKLISKKT